MIDDDYGQRAALAQTYKNGANWFYWIAALSLISSLIGFAGINWQFVLSLGTTQIIDGLAFGLAEALGEATKVIALVLDIFVVGICAGFGYLAGRRYLWAFGLGMVLFLLDSLILIWATDVFGIIIHAYALFSMFRGFQAGRELIASERVAAEQTGVPAEAPAPAATV